MMETLQVFADKSAEGVVSYHTDFLRYWGKADKNIGDGTLHHTVLGHSLDVAACAFVLLDRHPSFKIKVAALAGIDVSSVALTIACICSLHDVGKFDTRFQRKAPHIADLLRPDSSTVETGKYDHGTEGFRQVQDDDAAAALIVQYLGESAFSLLRAVCGHHGSLPSNDEPDGSRSLYSKTLRTEDSQVRHRFMHLMFELFAQLGAGVPWTSPPNGPIVQVVAGLCAVADWLGSNVDYFEYRHVDDDLRSYWSNACQRAVRACDDCGLLRAEALKQPFDVLFPGYEPRDVQLITERLGCTQPALIIVEAEMGKGKTEAALSLAARFITNKIAEGITIGLPTMATSNAMFARVEDFVPRLFSGEVQLALAHGRASRQPRFLRLLQQSLRVYDQDAPEASVMCAKWLASKKRVLLTQVGVGTIDQSLQAALIVRHQFVRMFGLSRNVVVIDEVHAYDAYMEVLLEHLLAWLGALRVPVILLSATLPSERRQALLAAWQGKADEASQTYEEAISQAYPLVSIGTIENVSTYSVPESDNLRSSRTVSLEHQTNDDGYLIHVAARLQAAARLGARVVWIRNTVREAQEAFDIASSDITIECTLFHARFRGCDRSLVEQRVLDRFGKTAQAGGRILIATQVVEQSLDLDFDEMHSDLAPIDLLFQRSGRLHRHVRPRFEKFAVPRLVIHAPSHNDVTKLRFGASQYVYDKATLWLTYQSLAKRTSLEVPGDIRLLVESVYHPAIRAERLAEGGKELVAAELKRQDILEGKRVSARRCCIPMATGDLSGEGTLSDDDDAVQAFTRDGESTTLLLVDWDGIGGRSLFATHDQSYWKIDPDAVDAWRQAGDLFDQTLSVSGKREGTVSNDSSWNIWAKRFAKFSESVGLGRNVLVIAMSRENDTYRGWFRTGTRCERIAYTKNFGLRISKEKEKN
jgi:CRISPR-associated endonuclease/helicase Cas3